MLPPGLVDRLRDFSRRGEGASYARRVASQIEQYRSVENIHELPAIFHYWSNRYLRPRMNELFGSDSIPEFYARPFLAAASRSSERPRFLSIGAGDCSVEISVARKLIELGLADFELVCLELSPHLVRRANAALESAGLSAKLSVRRVDVNSWRPEEDYSATMANHSLHHLVELESIFEGVRKSLRPGGVFVTNDMIGRNGHMRWPETLEVVELLWEVLPRRLKLNQQTGRWDDTFQNLDCSDDGFEGVRAQDILPLLVQTFQFQTFLAHGGFVDVFTDRSYGHNFDPTRLADTELLDSIHRFNEELIDNGEVKPTVMFAILGNERSASPASCWRHWSPQYCVRHVEQ
jgi:SAM-dependent methyltransferase